MHRIKRLELELSAGDARSAEDLLERCSRLFEPALAPVLDRVCGEFSGPGRLDRLDRLELDLETVAIDDFDATLAARLEAALRAALTRALAGRAGASRVAAARELVEVFARTGNLPWWAERAAEEPVSAAISALLDAGPAELTALLRELGGDPLALLRVARHCDASQRRALVERGLLGADTVDAPARGRPEPAANTAVDPPAPTAEATDATDAGRSDEPEGAAPAATGAPKDMSPETGDNKLESPLEVAVADAPEAERAAASPDAPAPAEPADGPQAPAPVAADAAPDDPTPTRDDPTPLALEPQLSMDMSLQTDAPATAAPRPPAAELRLRAERRRALAALDELFVADSGLVLLWPFVTRFFEHLGLLDERRGFVDAPAQLRAVALLEALATAEPEPAEYELALPKLLCGLSPEEGFLLARPLAPDELAECERLLLAVLGHVEALRGTSVAGLRAAFLRRPATLTTRDGAWMLRVEHRAHDVLLARFPWSWSWVKLPWMTDPLRVEWT